MTEWKKKILRKAEQAQFLLDTNEPEKLVTYFITNYIQSMVDEITKINPDFYSINRKEFITYIKIVNEEIMILIDNEFVKFSKLIGDKWVIVLNVEFVDSIPMIKRDFREIKKVELENIDLDYVMSEVFK